MRKALFPMRRIIIFRIMLLAGAVLPIAGGMTLAAAEPHLSEKLQVSDVVVTGTRTPHLIAAHHLN